MNQFIDRTSLFMTLVGLTSLLVGGIGVANGVRAWVLARARTIATLRCLGAAPRLVFAVCLVQVMALASLGVLAGLVVGAALPALAAAALAGVLPVVPETGPFLRPLLLAAALRAADRGGVRAVAAGAGDAHPGGGAVPRCAAAGRDAARRAGWWRPMRRWCWRWWR